MLEPTVENRSFFNERVAKFCDGDRALAEKVPIEALVKAVLEIQDKSEAERFLSGQIHWLRGRKPRTYEDALLIAKANITYCFEERMSKKAIDMWTELVQLDVEQLVVVPVSTKTPEQVFKESAAVGEQLKSGKDPGLAAALAKKALQKKAGTSAPTEEK